MMAMFDNLKDGTVTHLPKTTEFGESWHQWSQCEIDALELALAARRPLLVRGEPGTGKTQLARAAAEYLNWRFESTTIHSRYEAQDLQFRFDAVKRLADAQSLKTTGSLLRKHEAEYWEPGPLWRVFDWTSACKYGSWRTEAGKAAPDGHVLLIDEIDKAESDLPNALLEVLGQRSFRIPTLGRVIGGKSQRMPLVIFTTNEERELPAAFLRRCIVLTLDVDEKHYFLWLQGRGRAHFGTDVDGRAYIEEKILAEAAGLLCEDRQAARNAGLPSPGVAEYLDLLYALHDLAPRDTASQKSWLGRLNAYVLRKHGRVDGHPELAQRRS